MNNRRSILLVIIILFLIIGGNLSKKYYLKKFINLRLKKSPIEYVYYNIKGHPYVTIKGKEYELEYVVSNGDPKIHKGDTIIKYKGDMTVTIIRQNTRDTIYYTSLESR